MNINFCLISCEKSLLNLYTLLLLQVYILLDCVCLRCNADVLRAWIVFINAW
jgi:hypothetical protein